MSKVYKITIQLSEFDLRMLILWAKLHGRTKALYASQIISARTEANFDLIKKLVEDEARERGITPKDLERQWLIEGGFYSTEEEQT